MPLDDFPVTLRLPVLWGNQDLFGHVNNVVHVRWFESSRVAYWDAEMRETMNSDELGPILVNVSCDYQRQIRYPDTIHVGARIAKIGNTSLTMEHAIFSESTNGIAATGHSIVVMFNYKTQQATPISPQLREAIERTERRARST